MSQNWDFTCWVRVNDPEQLLQAARAHPDAAGMPTEDFYLDNGEISISACLIMLLDPGSLPGCSIDSSGAERAESLGDDHTADCAAGVHSWADHIGRLPADTPCAHCGEEYGDPA